MANTTQASQFIETSVQHSEWLKAIEAGPAESIVKLARENGFDCAWEDLQEAARELIGGKGQLDQKQIDEAASGMSDLESETGYGDDTGYAALYGVAGVILKM